MGISQDLYNKAKKLISGGTQLLSKRPEMFLPDLWPAYYKKAKGCEIWDLDGNKYIDASFMGIGACILGYADEDVDNAVKDAIDNGAMSTLNCPEEVELAELLCQIHPWADMVRYAKPRFFSSSKKLTVVSCPASSSVRCTAAPKSFFFCTML